MSSYRIVVEEDGQPVARGTAWLVEGTDKVVTTLHVVGQEKFADDMRAVWIWRHDGAEGDVGYFLDVNENDRVRLQPWKFDPLTDVALLQLENPVDGLVRLSVSDAGPARGGDWYGDGYWEKPPDRQSFSLAGSITKIHGYESNKAIQLWVMQGTDCEWKGMSGSPVCDEETHDVIAVLTSEITQASTLWAAHIDAVKRLLGRAIQREESMTRPEPSPLSVNLPPGFLDWFLGESKEALQSAQQCLRESRYDETLAICDREIARIESMGGDPRHDPELAPHWFDARLVRAACLLDLQNIDEAGEQARAIDREVQEFGSSYFDHHPRPILLAQILAQSGDLDRATELVRDLAEEDARAVRQHIEISRGHVPADWNELVAEPFVRLSACDVLLDRGEHDRAVGEILDVLQGQDLRPNNRAKAIAVLLRAMSDSYYGLSSTVVCIDAQRKRRAIAELQKYLDPEQPLLEGIVPENVLAPWIAYFHRLSWDRARVDQACERLRRFGLDDSPYRLVADESERPPPVEMDDAPVWLRLMNEAYRLHDDGNTDQALDVISRAVAEYPERPMLERAAAALHVAKGQPEKAVEHAKRAFDAFPGHGQAILWAKTLHAAGDPHTVWTKLHDELHGSPNLDARRVLAWAAYRETPARARDYWQEVIDTGRQTPLDRMHLARAMARTGDLAGAAEMAWQACEPLLDGELEEAGANETSVAICARLQWGSDSPEREERLLRLARALWQMGEKRSSRSAQLEYLDLWQRLDRPQDLPAPDVPRLLEQRVLVEVRRDDLEAVTGYRAHLTSLYVNGSLTLEDLAHQVAADDMELFERILQHEAALRTPLPRFAEPDHFSGREVLLGSFELAILDHLQLLAALPDALGPDGRLLLFQDVHRRMLEAPATLASRESPEQLGRMRALAERIGRSAVAAGEAQEDGSDLEWAAERGAILISTSPEVHEASGDVVSLRDVALWLHEQGELGMPQLAELLRERDLQPAEIDAAIRARLERAALAPWMFDETALHGLVRARLVREVFRFLDGRIAVTRSARMWLDQAIEEMERVSRARSRAQRIQRFLVELERKGGLRVIERPDVDLPPAKDDPDARMRRMWFQRALSWRRALLERPEAWLVSADSLCAEGVNRTAPAELYDALSIRTADDFFSLSDSLNQVDEQVASIVPLCRVLVHESRRDEILEKLALLGFADAYTAADLISHAEHYNGLDGVRPQRTLERIEGRGRRGLIVDGMWYRAHIGALYARTVFAAWCNDEPSKLRENITRTLLNRMLELDGSGPYSTLRGFFGHFCALVSEHPEHSHVQREDAFYQLSLEDSKAGAMWQAFNQWSSAQPEEVRDRLRTVLDQQASLLLRMADEFYHGDPSQLHIRFGSLLLMGGTVFQGDRPTIVPASLIDTISVLSALWPIESRPLVRPLQLDEGGSVSVEDWLAHGATLMADENSDIRWDGVAFWVPFPGSSIRLSCSPAALFLRSPASERSRLVAGLILAFGPDDGRIVGALHKLAKNPDDSQALRDYAHGSVLPPWQSFRLHPESIVEWGSPMCVGLFPNTLGELREVLSEPGPLPYDKEWHEVIVERMTEGAWRDREDRVELLKRSSELIADPLLPFMWRANTGAIDFDTSLRVLEHAHDHPSARLAFHLLVCIVSAGEQPNASEARQRVATLVGQLVEAAMHPPADTLAACESHLMHHAMWAVRTLNLDEGPRSRLMVPDWLWLTESLYLWMVRQLEALPREQRAAHLRTLRALSPERPGISWRASAFFSDPTRFGQGRLDIRLLLILRTLAYLKSERIQWLATDKLRRVLEQLRRRELTTEEREVQAPESAMPRSWAELPRTVPEMAAHVLQSLKAPRGPRANKARKKRGRKKQRRSKRT
jgi:tetratricopeptide (TPR) repeat protein